MIFVRWLGMLGKCHCLSVAAVHCLCTFVLLLLRRRPGGRILYALTIDVSLEITILKKLYWQLKFTRSWYVCPCFLLVVGGGGLMLLRPGLGLLVDEHLGVVLILEGFTGLRGVSELVVSISLALGVAVQSVLWVFAVVSFWFA